jgi:hypothetical protein
LRPWAILAAPRGTKDGDAKTRFIEQLSGDIFPVLEMAPGLQPERNQGVYPWDLHPENNPEESRSWEPGQDLLCERLRLIVLTRRTMCCYWNGDLTSPSYGRRHLEARRITKSRSSVPVFKGGRQPSIIPDSWPPQRGRRLRYLNGVESVMSSHEAMWHCGGRISAADSPLYQNKHKVGGELGIGRGRHEYPRDL